MGRRTNNLERPSGTYVLTFEETTLDLGDQVAERQEMWDFGIKFPDGSNSDSKQATSKQGMLDQVKQMILEYESSIT